jgi:hypothetical protein
MTPMEPSRLSKAAESLNVHSSINPEVPDFAKTHQTPKPSHKLNGTPGFKDGQLVDQSCAKVSSGPSSIGSTRGDMGVTRCSEMQPSSSGL